MDTSSEEEKTEKLLSQSTQAAYTHSLRQLPASIAGIDSITQFYNPSQSMVMDFLPPKNRQFTQRASSYTQFTQSSTISTIVFGSYALQRCDNPHLKFRPNNGLKLTDKQQCLLDNL